MIRANDTTSDSANFESDAHRIPLDSLAAIFHRAVARCGSVAEFCRQTGFVESNVRRYADQGNVPKVDLFLTPQVHGVKIPEPMLIDLLSLLCIGRRLKLTIEPAETPIGVDGADLVTQGFEVQRQALQLSQIVDEARRDGQIDAAEAANIETLSHKMQRTVGQLASNALTAATWRGGARRPV